MTDNENKEQYSRDIHFPSEKNVLKTFDYLVNTLGNGNYEALNSLQKLWNYEEKFEVNSIEEIRAKKLLNWENYRNKQMDCYEKIIKKYNIPNKL